MQLAKVYVVSVTLALLVSVASAVTMQGGRPKFEEIDVERINIVEKDGKLRMVISNRERQHHGSFDGQTMPRPNGRAPGIIFFNHRGDECGGLIFDGNGGKGHFVSLTMDKSRNDQTIGMQHMEGDNGEYFAGLTVWDRPHTSLADLMNNIEKIKKNPDAAARTAAFKELSDKGEFGAERITIAKLRDTSAVISLSDATGQPRIKIRVDPKGNPSLEFLDDNGKVIYTLPEDRTGG